MNATPNALKLAEQALASHRAKLATTANKNQVRRQIAAASAKVEQIRTALSLSNPLGQEQNMPDQTCDDSGKPLAPAWPGCQFYVPVENARATREEYEANFGPLVRRPSVRLTL